MTRKMDGSFANPFFTASRVTQLLAKLADSGLVYKNRHGRYCFAIPWLGDFIQRQVEEAI